MSNRRKLRKVPYGKPISSHDKPDFNSRLVQAKRNPDGAISFVVLDVVDMEVEPPYCTHGKTTCWGDCGEWLWLGCESYEIVAAGEVAGICKACAVKHFPPTARPVRRVNDTLHHD